MMAENDTDFKLDEMERDNLQKSISEVETVLTVSTPGTRALLENFLQNARGRVAVLDKRIKESEAAKTEHAREAAAVAVADLARKEAALTEREQESYSGFLAKGFFTKNDFASLEKFYDKTWDRLSDDGKDQMSHRFWEGIRRNEYQFNEAPSSVREKETEWAYATLVKRGRSPVQMQTIPEKDREEFIRAYEGGHRDEAERILERESFKEHMFGDLRSNALNHTRVETNREGDGKRIDLAANAESAKTTSKPKAPGGEADIDFSAFKLDGVKLSNAPKEISSTAIKSAVGTSPDAGSSFGRG